MEQPIDNDKFLFKRITEGDRLALNTLFAQYYKKLCSFANTHLHNQEEAEECVADVFFSLWKSRQNVIIEKSVKAYIYAATRNAALATLRKRNPVFEDIDALQEDMFEVQWGTEEIIFHKELEQQLDQAIDTLPTRCRQVFLMSRTESLSYKEISTLLCISEKTVENHLVKAIDFLRQALRIQKHNRKNVQALTEA